MNDIAGQKIIKIATLYFIPVNKSPRMVELPSFGFSPSDGFDYGQMRTVSSSGHDQFRLEGDDHHWVVVEIPASMNGDLRNMHDVENELSRAYRALHAQGLVPSMEAPAVIELDPFAAIMTHSWS